MGPIVLTVIIFILIALQYLKIKKEDSILKSALMEIPTNCKISLEKRIEGQSRRGVVKYYRSFVKASAVLNSGEVVEEKFFYEEHDGSKVKAISDAKEWILKVLKGSSSNPIITPKSIEIASRSKLKNSILFFTIIAKGVFSLCLLLCIAYFLFYKILFKSFLVFLF